jgi:hypothetical protein
MSIYVYLSESPPSFYATTIKVVPRPPQMKNANGGSYNDAGGYI